MNSWMSRKQALKDAQVTIFDAKRYLVAFSQFVPPDTILRANKVSPIVPDILAKFKTLEAAGLTIEQIEQSIAKELNNTTPEKVLVTNTKNIPVAYQNSLNSLAKIVQNQIETQSEIIRILDTEFDALRKRITLLETAIDKLTTACSIESAKSRT